MSNEREWTLTRESADMRAWRGTLPGMWAWLLQRVSAILILLFIVLHLFLPYRRPLQFLLLFVVAFHACLGVRVLLIDLGANVKTQKALFGGCVAAAIIALVVVWSYLPLGG